MKCTEVILDATLAVFSVTVWDRLRLRLLFCVSHVAAFLLELTERERTCRKRTSSALPYVSCWCVTHHALQIWQSNCVPQSLLEVLDQGTSSWLGELCQRRKGLLLWCCKKTQEIFPVNVRLYPPYNPRIYQWGRSSQVNVSQANRFHLTQSVASFHYFALLPHSTVNHL